MVENRDDPKTVAWTSGLLVVAMLLLGASTSIGLASSDDAGAFRWLILVGVAVVFVLAVVRLVLALKRIKASRSSHAADAERRSAEGTQE